MRSKKIIVLVLISLLVLGVTACNVGNRPLTRGDTTPDLLDRDRTVTPYTNDGYRYGPNYSPYRYDNRYGTYGRDGTYGRFGTFDRDYRTNRFRTTANRDADRMADIAARVKGVDDATVVIAGGSAYVGLDLEDRVQSKNAESVESKVYSALSRFATRYNISITSDDDLMGRLRDIGDGIRGGAPFTRYQTDFRDFDTRFRTFTR